jgi:4-hydroxy-tetrahydrodipicolinate reductase
MGQRLVALAMEDESLAVVAAIDRVGHPAIGRDAGEHAGAGPLGVTIGEALEPGDADVLIDFSLPDGFREALAECVGRGLAMVVGTTGLSDGDHAAIDEAGKVIPVLQAPNMSLGVNLLFALAARTARQLGDDYDIEIVEAHHRFKVDAPSGTALGIARAICDATGKDMNRDLVHGREGESPRQRGQIGMHALRLGDVVGRHTVSFATLGEELQLTHNATSRDVFARGALRAAQWLAGKPAGRYGMADVLGLRA